MFSDVSDGYPSKTGVHGKISADIYAHKQHSTDSAGATYCLKVWKPLVV